MINIFQLADNDQSILYLGQIFGNVGFALAGTGPALLSTMFKVFNTTLLAVGAMIVTYTTVMGVLATAQEGEFLGKKWHKLWVPLRMVMGIAALFPTGSGYCAIQVLVMWIVVQGIGAADTVWKSTVVYLGRGGAVQTSTSAPPGANDIASNIPRLIKQMFANSVCQAALTKFSTNDANATSSPRLNPETNTYSYGFNGGSQCGTVGSFKANANLDKNSDEYIRQTEVEKAGRTAMQSVVPVVNTIANQYVNAVIEDEKCWEPCPFGKNSPLCPFFGRYLAPKFKDNTSCIINSPQTGWENISSYSGSNFMASSTRLFYGYSYNIQAMIDQRIAQKAGGTSVTKLPDESYNRALVNGWIFAGAYYYYIALQNNKALQDKSGFINSFRQEEPDFTSPESDTPLKKFPIQTFYGPSDRPDTGARAVIDKGAMPATSRIGGGGSVSRHGTGPMSELGSASTRIIHNWMDKITPTSDENPLVRIQNFGEELFIGAEVLFWLSFGIVIGLGAASTYLTALGTTVNPAAGIFAAILQFIYTPMIFLITYLVTVGALLGVYTPLVPYIYFTFAAIGWFLAVVDAMVAAPIIALGILSPGGQSEILGRAEPALMILLNVFLRPTLMVFGMMAAMLLSFAIISFINAAFFNVVASISRGHDIGVIQAFLFIFAYAGLVITALNKCFALIYMLPDQLLRWIGGHAEAFGEKAAEAGAGEAKGMVTGAAKAAPGMIPGAAAATGLSDAGYRSGKGGDKDKGDGDVGLGSPGGTGSIAPGGASKKPLGGSENK